MMTDEILPVYIGYDSREHDAYQVCKSSLLRHASGPVHIQPLDERMLRHAGLYRRKWQTENGQKIDTGDKRPFSTEFSFTRFLVPALTQWQGWAIFVDCDFLFRADISLIQRSFNPKYAVMCCKQVYVPKSETKMDGQVQQAYARKNWSSFMAFNSAHPSNQRLTPHATNYEYGSWLHSFSWLAESEVGDLDHRWNWIQDCTEGEPLAVHMTTGGPWFAHMQDVAYADEWRAEANRIGLKVAA